MATRQSQNLSSPMPALLLQRMQQHCAPSLCFTVPLLCVLNPLRLAGVETRFPFSKVFDGSATQVQVFDSLADLPDATVDT